MTGLLISRCQVLDKLGEGAMRVACNARATGRDLRPGMVLGIVDTSIGFEAEWR